MFEKVEQVNKLLLAGEPGNISVDEHADYTGYKPQHIIDAMNQVFWGAWGFAEISSEIVPGDKGGIAIAQVQVWLKEVEFQPVAWGQNRVTRGDIGDARKGAQTDAIKKALSYFSIGNRAYHGLLVGKPVKSSQNGHSPTPTKLGNSILDKQPSSDAVSLSLAIEKLKKRAYSQGIATTEAWLALLAKAALSELASLSDVRAVNMLLNEMAKQPATA